MGIITPEGTFYSEFLGFGPKNAPSASSRMLHGVLEGLQDHCIGRIDDIQVASEDEGKHLEILKEIFKRLQEKRIMLNVEKTQLFQDSLVFMGFQVDAHGIALKDFTVEKIRNAEEPKTVKELKSFVGLAQWARPFADSGVFADNMAALTEALKRTRKFYLTEDEKAAFNSIKTIELTKLVHPDWSQVFHLYTDASDHSIHSILSQSHGSLHIQEGS